MVAHSDNGASPASAAAPTTNVVPTTGHRPPTPRSAVSRSVPTTVSQAPAARNSRLLVAAWATRWAAPAVTPPAPAATTMNPIWAQVEAASSCLSSGCTTATAPSTSAVAAPAQTTSVVAHPVALSRGCRRNSR